MKKIWWLLIGIVVGLSGGLIYTWVINPVKYENILPGQMQVEYRSDWIRMSGLAYGGGSSFDRTQVRLTSLPVSEVRSELGRTLDDSAAAGHPLPVLRRVAELAQRYGVDTPAVKVYTGISAKPFPTQTPMEVLPSVTPPAVTVTSVPVLPTSTPTALPPTLVFTTPVPPAASPYLLVGQEQSCGMTPEIILSVTEEITKKIRRQVTTETVGIPGLTAWLLWGDGADRAVTGMRPEEGLGYVDFEVTPGEIYNLYLDSPTGAPLAVLTFDPCTGEGESGLWPVWYLTVHRESVASPP